MSTMKIENGFKDGVCVSCRLYSSCGCRVEHDGYLVCYSQSQVCCVHYYLCDLFQEMITGYNGKCLDLRCERCYPEKVYWIKNTGINHCWRCVQYRWCFYGDYGRICRKFVQGGNDVYRKNISASEYRSLMRRVVSTLGARLLYNFESERKRILEITDVSDETEVRVS